MELYVHLPFCKSKCQYCAFVSFPDCEQEIDPYIDLLLREAILRKEEQNEPLETVYIGGGTPSVLTETQIGKLISGLQAVFSFDKVREFTVEGNPGTISLAWLQTLRNLGVNRLSVGMQASDDAFLLLLGRGHRFPDVLRTAEIITQTGLENWNLDLIFGIPGQSALDWHKTLEKAMSLHPTHISAYGLIPEEGTPLFGKLQDGLLSLPDPEKERAMYDHAIELLAKHGFFQYEISNFALPGFACRHNIGYWQQVPYLGLGLSAASMTGCIRSPEGMRYLRRTNPSSFRDYAAMIVENKTETCVLEEITQKEARFETVMLALRMNEGIREDRFLALHGIALDQVYGEILSRLESQALLEHRDHCWRLTRRGMDIQNSILLEFMGD